MALSGSRNHLERETFSTQMPRRDRTRKRAAPAAIVALALSLVLAASGLAAPALDPGFGVNGVVRTKLPGPEALRVSYGSVGPLISDLALRRDGRVVGAMASGTEASFIAAVGYRPDGRLDRGFGVGGFVDIQRTFRGISDVAKGEAIAVQPDGKIVLAGSRKGRASTAFGSRKTSPLLIRLLPSGRPDPSFGPRGLVSPPPREKGGETLHGVAVQRGGRIVAVGARNERRGGEPAGLVIGYRADGRLDRGFGNGGRVLFPHKRIGYTSLRDVAVLPSGKLLVAGYLGGRFLIARLLPDGALDRGFGVGGRVLIGRQLRRCCLTDAALSVLPRGEFLAAGLVSGESQTVFRLQADGGLKRAFTRSRSLRGWNDGMSSMVDLATQADGRIVLATTAARIRPDDSGKSAITILRALPNGRPDRSFDGDGVKQLPLGLNAAGTSALTLRDGSVLVGGGTQLRSDGSELGVDFAYELVLARVRR